MGRNKMPSKSTTASRKRYNFFMVKPLLSLLIRWEEGFFFSLIINSRKTPVNQKRAAGAALGGGEGINAVSRWCHRDCTQM
jgi:hypothetical protein